ncbi:AcrR family transcriptional regulator [Elusimicrobium simillimum]|uniref:TetR/AcrR family transcriptional regulator n=1 Tax=Elusimicrobium simillimum TaxID=3143438 RepID=UPI003C702DE6
MTKKISREQKMRSRIIHKAFNLMSKKGINQVSMREIAEEIGVSKPVLYYYFKNKEDLCHSIIMEGVSGFNKAIEVAYNSGASLQDLLSMAFVNQLEFFTKDKKMYAFILHLMSYSFNDKKGSKTFLEARMKKRCIWETFLAQQEKIGAVPRGSGEDLSHLLGALSAHLLLNAHNSEFTFDKTMPARFTKIILLGLKEYYKDK